MVSSLQDHKPSPLTCYLQTNVGKMMQDAVPAKPSAFHLEWYVSRLGLFILYLQIFFIQHSIALNFSCYCVSHRPQRLRNEGILKTLASYQQVIPHVLNVLTTLAKAYLISLYPVPLDSLLGLWRIVAFRAWILVHFSTFVLARGCASYPLFRARACGD